MRLVLFIVICFLPSVVQTVHDSKSFILISTSIESSIFATCVDQGMSHEMAVKLVNIYKGFNVDLESGIAPTGKLIVLAERSTAGGKNEKILHTAFTTDRKSTGIYYYKLKNNMEGYFNMDGKGMKRFIHPLYGKEHYVSSNFGSRHHPIHDKVMFHKGIDYAAKHATPICAAADGIIEYIGKNGGYGNYIRLKHDGEYMTCYAHVSKFSSSLKIGSVVQQGEIIAYVGSTGTATGPHLHYEIIYNGNHIDPMMFKDTDRMSIPKYELTDFQRFVDSVGNIVSSKVYPRLKVR